MTLFDGKQRMSTEQPNAAAMDPLIRLPKAEIHVHLEGCFEPSALEQWAEKAGTPMPRPRDRLFEFKGLSDFLNFLDWACGLADSEDRLVQACPDGV